MSNAPVYPPANTWLLAEDEALKQMLVDTLKVPDNKGALQSVPVWFRYPEAERQIKYPFCTVELLGIEPAYDLWTSEYDLRPNAEIEEESDSGMVSGHRLHDPSTAPDIPVSDFSVTYARRHYLAYRLFYQLGLWSRSILHDRFMTSEMLRSILLPRPSWLYVPADATWRRLEVLSWNPADMVVQEGGSKRVFRKIFTISIQADIAQDRLADVHEQMKIRRLSLRMFEKDTGEMFTEDESTDYWEQLWPKPGSPPPEPTGGYGSDPYGQGPYGG